MGISFSQLRALYKKHQSLRSKVYGADIWNCELLLMSKVEISNFSFNIYFTTSEVSADAIYSSKQFYCKGLYISMVYINRHQLFAGFIQNRCSYIFRITHPRWSLFYNKVTFVKVLKNSLLQLYQIVLK